MFWRGCEGGCMCCREGLGGVPSRLGSQDEFSWWIVASIHACLDHSFFYFTNRVIDGELYQQVRLVASVPGYHSGSNLKKIRTILEECEFEEEFIKAPLVYQKSPWSQKTVSARTDATVAFHAADHKQCKLSEADLDAFVEKYMADSPVHVCLLEDQERINFSTATHIAVRIDHFDCGFKFPILWEIAEIFEHYCMVSRQLAPNTQAANYSYISYLRSEKIVDVKVMGFPNKIHNWTSSGLGSTRKSTANSDLSDPTQREWKKKIVRKRKEQGDPSAVYSSSKSFCLEGFGKNLKDLRGNPMIHWHSKGKHVRLSTALPSYKSPKISRHAHVAISTLYGKRNMHDH
ncbi:hypothetical protein KSP39_PZI007929 [Platanthera zijinensis]|uniref:Uncharacterized protein n=1 Tax=Platanthera zijinensis TaxID=2320716 RepID=A0AAP0BMI6_9ASPA